MTRCTLISLTLLSAIWGIAHPQTTRVCFTPRSHCTSFVTTEIQRVQSQILVQAYYLTSPAILQALGARLRAGVQVEILLDRSQKNLESNWGRLFTGGARVLIDTMHPIAHAKVLLIDRKTLLFGSYNWTRQAEKLGERGCDQRARAGRRLSGEL